MVIYTILLRTVCQHNEYCVDHQSKIEPYIKECMKKAKKSNKYVNNRYTIKWLMIDFAVIYEANEKGEPIFDGNTLKQFGEIKRQEVH